MKTSQKHYKIALISGLALLLTALIVWIKVKATPNKTGFFNKLFGSNKLLMGDLNTPEQNWYKVKTAYEYRGFLLDVGYGESFAVNDYVYGYVSGDVVKTKTRDFETSIPLINVELVAADKIDSLILKPLASLLEMINKSDIVVSAIQNQKMIDSLTSRSGSYDVFTESNFVNATVEINIKTGIDLALNFDKNLEGKYVVVLAKKGRVRNEDLLKVSTNSTRSSGLPYSNFDIVKDKGGMLQTLNRPLYEKVVLTYDPDFIKNDGSVNGQKVEIYFLESFSGTSASKDGSPVASVINGVFAKDKIYQGSIYTYLGISLGIDITKEDGGSFYLPFSNGIFAMQNIAI